MEGIKLRLFLICPLHELCSAANRDIILVGKYCEIYPSILSLGREFTPHNLARDIEDGL